MNRRDMDVILSLAARKYVGQRDLAEDCGCSLGAINASIKNLLTEGFLDPQMEITEKARNLLRMMAPERAVILAAGSGMRMVPINTETPKALLEVRGVPMIERLIEQLNAVGIVEIYVVVGFAKEQFEYLIDKYGVELIVNPEYANKNNLHSLTLAKDCLKNCYIIPCDMWCEENPFRETELYSWYMVSDKEDAGSSVRVNRKQELALVPPMSAGNTMIGISYLVGADSETVRNRLACMDLDRRYEGSFWEETLYEGDKFLIGARVVPAQSVVEINTYEQLRELDSKSTILKSEPVSEIARVFHVNESEIHDIAVIKKGMTNRSFSFWCADKQYIMRIPGEGTDKLINRRNEARVYEVISETRISDDVIYIGPDTGFKISAFLNNARPCDPLSENDVRACMKKLRRFHELRLKVEHEFDVFERINYYESLWNGAPSVYKDYEKTKENVFSLRSYIDAQEKDWCLTHVDAVPDNFLFVNGPEEQDGILLIDWEYAAMQDPHLDIAMFCIYSLYNRQQVDFLISAYFPEGYSDALRLKIYCYIAAGGLLWSNWCEFKLKCGIEFGEYSLKQYRYAKDYYRIVMNELRR